MQHHTSMCKDGKGKSTKPVSTFKAKGNKLQKGSGQHRACHWHRMNMTWKVQSQGSVKRNLKEGKARIWEGKLKTARRSIISVIHRKGIWPWTLWLLGGSAVGLDISLMFSFHFIQIYESSSTKRVRNTFAASQISKCWGFSSPVAGIHDYSCWCTKVYFQPSLLPSLLLWQETVAKCEYSKLKATLVTRCI